LFYDYDYDDYDKHIILYVIDVLQVVNKHSLSLPLHTSTLLSLYDKRAHDVTDEDTVSE